MLLLTSLPVVALGFSACSTEHPTDDARYLSSYYAAQGEKMVPPPGKAGAKNTPPVTILNSTNAAPAR